MLVIERVQLSRAFLSNVFLRYDVVRTTTNFNQFIHPNAFCFNTGRNNSYYHRFIWKKNNRINATLARTLSSMDCYAYASIYGTLNVSSWRSHPSHIRHLTVRIRREQVAHVNYPKSWKYKMVVVLMHSPKGLDRQFWDRVVKEQDVVIDDIFFPLVATSKACIGCGYV